MTAIDQDNFLISLELAVGSASETISAADTPTLCTLLDETAVKLARDHAFREALGCAQPSLWPLLRKLWLILHRAHQSNAAGSEESIESPQTTSIAHDSTRVLTFSLSRFTRNVVAGVPSNQNEAFANEGEIRGLIHLYTSWTVADDPEAVAIARMLTQALSNMITANDTLSRALWESYLDMPEEQVILIRLLSSTNGKLALPALMVINNCITGSHSRAQLILDKAVGIRLCILLLDKMEATYDAEDGTEEASAFDVGYSIFTHLVEAGVVINMYSKLSMQDEVVTPHQTVLLKLLDSYLQSKPIASEDAGSMRLAEMLCPFFGQRFFALSAYAQRAIGNALSSDSGQSGDGHHLAELDLMLPKVCEALVLVSQCVTALALFDEAQTNLHKLCVELRSDTRMLDEDIVELLRFLDRFLPRITFGRPAPGPTGVPQDKPPQNQATTGFTYLKRDLVRLLGTLAHACRPVQDRVRKCGGIEAVMNLCVVDERNPFLREHAIFALRNILHGNVENQAVVNEIRPSSEWGEDGMLRQDPNASVLK